MKRAELKATIVEWANAIGANEALARLVRQKISPSMAEKLIRGRYPSEPIEIVRDVLLRELAKDGFVLTDEAV